MCVDLIYLLRNINIDYYAVEQTLQYLFFVVPEPIQLRH